MDEHHGDDVGVPATMRASFDGIIVEDAPNAVVDSIVSAFVQARRVESPIGRAVRHVRAVLTVDGGLARPAPAFRSGVSGPGPLHVVYRTEGPDDTPTSEIALSVYGGVDNDVLVGQVFDTGDENRSMVVEVLKSTRLVAVSPIGATGEFSMEAPIGWTELVVVTADAEITVPAPAGQGSDLS